LVRIQHNKEKASTLYITDSIASKQIRLRDDGLTTEISKLLNKLKNVIEINRYWKILSPKVRRTGREADHLPPSRAEAKSKCSYSAHSSALMEWTRTILHVRNLTYCPYA